MQPGNNNSPAQEQVKKEFSDFPRQIEGTWTIHWKHLAPKKCSPAAQLTKLSTSNQSVGAELGNLTQIVTKPKKTDIPNLRRLEKTIIGT